MLTSRQLEVLRTLADAHQREDWENAELVCEGRECWYGEVRTNWTTVYGLLRHMCLKDTSEHGKGTYRYSINETGLVLARHPDAAKLLQEAIAKGGAFQLVDLGDRVEVRWLS